MARSLTRTWHIGFILLRCWRSIWLSFMLPRLVYKEGRKCDQQNPDQHRLNYHLGPAIRFSKLCKIQVCCWDAESKKLQLPHWTQNQLLANVCGLALTQSLSSRASHIQAEIALLSILVSRIVSALNKNEVMHFSRSHFDENAVLNRTRGPALLNVVHTNARHEPAKCRMVLKLWHISSIKQRGCKQSIWFNPMGLSVRQWLVKDHLGLKIWDWKERLIPCHRHQFSIVAHICISESSEYFASHVNRYSCITMPLGLSSVQQSYSCW